MTVHIGQVTSEVRSTAPIEGGGGEDEEVTEWEQRLRMGAAMDRLSRDRLRTSTGHGYD